MSFQKAKRAFGDILRLGPLITGFVTSRSRKTNIIMLHFGRCGSTVIGNMFRQNSEIYWDSEVLQYRKERLLPECRLTVKPKSIIRLRMLRGGSRPYALEIKPLAFMHLSSDQLAMNLNDFFSYLKKLNFNKIIFLERHNYLRQLVSTIIAIQKGKYERGVYGTRQLDSVSLSLNATVYGQLSMVELFEEYDRVSKEIVSLASNKDFSFLSLNYKDHISVDPRIAYSKVCQFCEIDDQSPEIINQRVNPFPLSEIIDNWAEVTNYLSGTKYAWMTESEE